MNTKELNTKMLTEEQVQTVREMIVLSLEGMYIDTGVQPSSNFYGAANKIADEIIKKVQKALIQVNVFKRAVEKSKPLAKKVPSKVVTRTKKTIKKTKKNVRK